MLTFWPRSDIEIHAYLDDDRDITCLYGLNIEPFPLFTYFEKRDHTVVRNGKTYHLYVASDIASVRQLRVLWNTYSFGNSVRHW